MIEPKWITIQMALAVHERMILFFGGSAGVRDQGLLESALHRPRNAYEYEENPSIERLAAVMAHGIAMNHPFVDGNKRAAFTVMSVVLGLNGKWLATTEAEAASAMIALASGDLDDKELEAWLIDRCVLLTTFVE